MSIGSIDELRFLRYGSSYAQCCRALTFASARLSCTLLIGVRRVGFSGQPQYHAAPMVTVQVQPQAPQVFPPQPVQMACPNCHQVVTTVTQPRMGLLAWLIVGGLCFFGSVTIVDKGVRGFLASHFRLDLTLAPIWVSMHSENLL